MGGENGKDRLYLWWEKGDEIKNNSFLLAKPWGAFQSHPVLSAAREFHLLRMIKLRLRAVIPPVIFLLITGYFAWNAVHGARGLEAQAVERAQLAKATQYYAAVDALRAEWEMKTSALSGNSIAPDMLDEQTRLVLNLADPADLVVQLPASLTYKTTK